MMNSSPTRLVARTKRRCGALSILIAAFLASPVDAQDATDSMRIAEHLGGAIRFPTISPADIADFEGQPFLDLAAYLRQTYPRVHAELGVEVIADYSLLYTWKGSSTDLEPALFMSHLDVVPVEPGTESEWTHPPFDGVVADGFVWGRGALDVKCGVIIWLEAVEALLSEGVVPERTIHLAFGHDEERGGANGAAAIASTLEARGTRIAFLFDEGGGISPDNPLTPGVPTALVFVAEKTFLTLRLTAHGEGGHSSIPPFHTSVGKLASAIHRLEANPMPARLTPPMRAMLISAAPYQSFGQRFAFNNLWLTEGAILRAMMKDELQRVMVHTTTAATMIHGGVKDNVVPEWAEAMVNFRLLPGDTAEDVVEHVRSTIDDPDVDIEPLGWSPAPPPAAIDGVGFELIQQAVTGVLPQAIVLPALLPGATDTRHYVGIVGDAYRFVPVQFSQELMKGFHGRDERLPIEELGTSVEIAKDLVRSSALPGS